MTCCPEALRAVHRAHRTRFRAEPTVRAMGAGSELWARRSDGSEFPVEISLSPLHLDDDVFAVAAVRDVSARVAAEDQLHRVLRTLDATDDAVFIFDAVTLRFSFVNDGAVRLVGYQRDELLTMTPLHLNPYTTESEYRRLVDALVADGARRWRGGRSCWPRTARRYPSRRRCTRRRAAAMAAGR